MRQRQMQPIECYLSRLPPEILTRIAILASDPADSVNLGLTCSLLRAIVLSTHVQLRIRARQSGIALSSSTLPSSRRLRALNNYAAAFAAGNWVRRRTIRVPAPQATASHGDGVLVHFELNDHSWHAVVTRLASPMRGVDEVVRKWPLPTPLLVDGERFEGLPAIIVEPQYDLIVFLWHSNMRAPFEPDGVLHLCPLRLSTGLSIQSGEVVTTTVQCFDVYPAFDFSRSTQRMPLSHSVVANNGRFLALNVCVISVKRTRLLIVDFEQRLPAPVLFDPAWCRSLCFLDDRHVVLLVDEPTLSYKLIIVDLCTLPPSSQPYCAQSGIRPVLVLLLPFNALSLQEPTPVERTFGKSVILGSRAGVRRSTRGLQHQGSDFAFDSFSFMSVHLPIPSEEPGLQPREICDLILYLSLDAMAHLVAECPPSAIDPPVYDFDVWARSVATVANRPLLPTGALGWRSTFPSEFGLLWEDVHPARRSSTTSALDPHALRWGMRLADDLATHNSVPLCPVRFRLTHESLSRAGLSLVTEAVGMRWNAPEGPLETVRLSLSGDSVLYFQEVRSEQARELLVHVYQIEPLPPSPHPNPKTDPM
ncbi:hypothetical protein PENSPDRAFT_690291 [Peniophora sp. CONT]|nr:hypothetical protein PENSPDRAFT_690291 [Peniophora sp. CONT]